VARQVGGALILKEERGNLVREMVSLEQWLFKNKTAPGQDCPRTAFKVKTG